MSALAMAAQPLAAHPGEQHTPAAQPKTALLSDEATVRAVLSQYKAAIERLDATRTGEIVKQRGVATSGLKKVGGQWKIISMHNSARKTEGS